jgi:hypothetical protein
MTHAQLDIEIAFAKRKARDAVDRLRRDISTWGSPDISVRDRARAAMTRVTYLRDQRKAAT